MESPLKHVKEKFVAIFLALSYIGLPFTVGETMALIQSLIEGTPGQQKLIKFQKRLKAGNNSTNCTNDCLGKISTKYYYSFMRRHKVSLIVIKAIVLEPNIPSGSCTEISLTFT